MATDETRRTGRGDLDGVESGHARADTRPSAAARPLSDAEAAPLVAGTSADLVTVDPADGDAGSATGVGPAGDEGEKAALGTGRTS